MGGLNRDKVFYCVVTPPSVEAKELGEAWREERDRPPVAGMWYNAYTLTRGVESDTSVSKGCREGGAG